MVTWILWALILAMLAWMGFNYLRIRRAAKIVDNEEFEALIRTGQLIDLLIQQNSTENISLGPAIFLQVSWRPVLQPFVRINLSFSTKTNVRNVLQMQPFTWKNKVFLRFISFLMAWILGEGKSKLRNKKTSLEVSELIFFWESYECLPTLLS